MKNSFKCLLAVITLSFASCSKNDTPDPVLDTEKTFKIEVDYQGDTDNFEETLVFQVTSSKANSMKIVEKELSKEIPAKDVVWFTKPNSPIVKNSTYTTSEKGSVITLAGVIVPINIDEGSKNISATIKFYVDGKLKETKTITSKSDVSSTPFSFPVVAN